MRRALIECVACAALGHALAAALLSLAVTACRDPRVLEIEEEPCIWLAVDTSTVPHDTTWGPAPCGTGAPDQPTLAPSRGTG